MPFSPRGLCKAVVYRVTGDFNALHGCLSIEIDFTVGNTRVTLGWGEVCKVSRAELAPIEGVVVAHSLVQRRLDAQALVGFFGELGRKCFNFLLLELVLSGEFLVFVCEVADYLFLALELLGDLAGNRVDHFAVGAPRKVLQQKDDEAEFLATLDGLQRVAALELLGLLLSELCALATHLNEVIIVLFCKGTLVVSKHCN